MYLMLNIATTYNCNYYQYKKSVYLTSEDTSSFYFEIKKINVSLYTRKNKEYGKE